jgi:hypothetical protein
MPRPLAALVLAVSIGLLPNASSALVIEFSALVDGVIDTSNRLDGSVAIGTLVTGTYRVDPTPSGGVFGEVGPGRLEFAVGNYRFDQSADPSRIHLLNDTGPPIAPVDIWETQDFVTAQLTPALSQQANGVGYRASLVLLDNTATNITGTELSTFVVEDLADWTESILFLEALVDDLAGGTMIGDLQMTAAIQSWQVVPEPGSAALVATGLIGLVQTRRRQS